MSLHWSTLRVSTGIVRGADAQTKAKTHQLQQSFILLSSCAEQFHRED